MIKDENKFNFTEEQKEVLIGLLLGDGYLEQMSEVTYRLKIEQSAEKSEYINHLYEIFKDCCSKEPILKIKPNGNKSLFFQTKTSISLNFYGKQFYRDKIKVIPLLLGRWLTPRVLAYWYMDDGSLKSKESKATILNTQGFTKVEVDFLIELLKKNFNLEAKIRSQKDGYQIYISGHSYELLKSLIYSYLLDTMKYKFPLERKTEI